MDSGRSGHGRVIMIFFELCEKIWGGSPATEQLNGGIESVDLAGKDSSASSEGSKNANTSLEGGDTSVNLDNFTINNASFQVDNDNSERDTHHTEEPDHSEAHTDGCVATTIKQRRELWDNQLKNYKQEESFLWTHKCCVVLKRN